MAIHIGHARRFGQVVVRNLQIDEMKVWDKEWLIVAVRLLHNNTFIHTALSLHCLGEDHDAIALVDVLLAVLLDLSINKEVWQHQVTPAMVVDGASVLFHSVSIALGTKMQHVVTPYCCAHRLQRVDH